MTSLGVLMADRCQQDLEVLRGQVVLLKEKVSSDDKRVIQSLYTRIENLQKHIEARDGELISKTEDLQREVERKDREWKSINREVILTLSCQIIEKEVKDVLSKMGDEMLKVLKISALKQLRKELKQEKAEKAEKAKEEKSIETIEQVSYPTAQMQGTSKSILPAESSNVDSAQTHYQGAS